MQKTPQEFKRENVKKLFNKILGSTETNLEPLSISTSESLNDDFTTTEFSFQETGHVNRLILYTLQCINNRNNHLKCRLMQLTKQNTYISKSAACSYDKIYSQELIICDNMYAKVNLHLVLTRCKFTQLCRIYM